MQSELSGFPNCAGPAAMSLFPFSQTLSSGLLCQLGFRLLRTAIVVLTFWRTDRPSSFGRSNLPLS